MKIGILGGGQLAGMLVEAGVPAGLGFLVVDPKPDACAARLAEHRCADWSDPAALDALSNCDRVTCDFENVPAGILEALESRVQVRPSARALAAAQDRLIEKQRFKALGLETPEFMAVDSRTDLKAAVEHIGLPAVLKTRRMGYDGKGQAVLRDSEDLELTWQRLGEHALILEQWIGFDHECAITVVRAADGRMRFWPLTRTWHSDGILRLAVAPCPAAETFEARARDLAGRLAEDLDYVGCLTLELFAAGDRLLANEFAPRVHNSAHWTIEGAQCSQFSNHLRAVCDWPLGATDAAHRSVMINFIGRMPDPAPWLAVDGVSWHDYSKAAREGRKVGHATLVAADSEQFGKRVSMLRPLLERRVAQALESIAADC